MMLVCILSFVAGVAVAAPTSTCDQTVFNECASLYSSVLGIPVTENSTAFAVDYEALIKKAEYRALEVTCTAQRFLQLCLGGEDTYNQCFSVANLKAFGLKDQDAYTYASLAATFDAECSPEIFPVFNRNIKCMGIVYESQGYTHCVATFTEHVQKDPTHLCQYAQEYVDCLKTVYAAVCPPEVTADICKVTAAAFKASAQPPCTLNC